MAFKRRFMHRRRRRLMPETFTIQECFQCSNVWRTTPCGGALTDVICLMHMELTKNPSDSTEVVSPSEKHVLVDAIKFQSEHSTDPNKWAGNSAFEVSVQSLQFLQRIWEMVIVLPTAPGGGFVPAYIPQVTTQQQMGDLADRVLWKRLTIMPMWGLDAQAGSTFAQLQTTIRDEGHGPVAVKSKVRLDDKHGLYYVRTFVNDLFGLPTYPLADCTFRPTTDPFPNQVIPVEWDANFKIFYHSTKR